jgi:hypothetical protein
MAKVIPMDTSDQIQLHMLRERQGVVQLLLIIQQRLLLLALLVASVIAPLTALVDQPDTDESTTDARGLFASIGSFFENDAEDFGDRETHPHGLDAGLVTTRVGLLVLGVAVLCALLATLALWAGSSSRGLRRVVAGAGIAVIVAAAAILLGLTWLPDSDDLATTASGWLWLPVAAGAWALYHVWSLGRLD